MTYQAPSEEATRPEIAFFDLETTVPMRAGQGYALLEFGAIVVCPNRLVELASYSTLIRPSDLSAISPRSVSCNGIDRETAASAPSFVEVADRIFQILHGRVWAGHNILRFDCVRIQEAFVEIGRPFPQPRGTIDTLPLLTQTFGRRAGDMKMATLAAYFGLGQQKHRSLDDVRMNLEVLKYCATVLFLESNFTDMFRVNNLVHEITIPRNNADGNASPEEIRLNVETDVTTAASSTPVSNMENHLEQMRINQNEPMENFRSTICTTLAAGEGCSRYAGFLQPDEVSLQCVSASLATPFQQSWHRILILHKDDPLQLCQMGLKILFGLSTKFVDKLSFVVNVEPNLQQILEFCDHLAQNSHLESGSSSQWMPVINTSYANSSSIRLRISNLAMYPTDIYQKEPSGDTRKLVFSKTDATELDMIIVPGNMVDAYFNLETYDYQQYAGIRLVAQRLVLHAS